MESQKCLLSIIIPVYNTEQYLEQCLESLLEQKISLFEIIIINDGSTDNSSTIIESYAKKHKNIIYYNQQNKGQGAARNLGVNLSKGKYIYFMDSDDLIKKNTLHYLLSELITQELDAVFFDAETFVSEDYIDANQFQPNYNRKKEYGIFDSGEQLMNAMIVGGDFTVSPCLYLVKKTVLIKHNIVFKEGFIHEDYAFTSEIFLKTQKVKHINNSIFLRRIRTGSTMTSKNIEKEIHGQLNAFKSLVYLYETHVFLNENSKKNFSKLIMNKLIKFIDVYQMTSYTKRTYLNLFSEVEEIAASHGYFNIKAKLLLKHYYIYKIIRRVVNKF